MNNFTGIGIDKPKGITLGPDGALWFCNSGNDTIGRITTSGVVTNYTGTGIKKPEGITSGPDGALWFTNHDSIGRITTSGAVTNYRGTASPIRRRSRPALMAHSGSAIPVTTRSAASRLPVPPARPAASQSLVQGVS